MRSDSGVRGDAAVRGDIVSHTLKRISDSSPLDRAIAEARDALIAQQHEQGYWLYELEADCTIPAEYIMMMHFLDEIDARARGEDRQPPARAAGRARRLAAVSRRRHWI